MAAKPKKTKTREERFAEEYILDLNGTQAAARAGYTGDAASLATQGNRMLRNAEVVSHIERLKGERSARKRKLADEVVERIRAIAFADPQALTELRRVPCEHCWQGIERVQSPKLTLEPNADCIFCNGDGAQRVMFKDTRKIKGANRHLFVAVEETANGLKVKTKDQMHALELLGKHLGIFVDKVEVTGKDGGAVAMEISDARDRLAKIAARIAAEPETPPGNGGAGGDGPGGGEGAGVGLDGAAGAAKPDTTGGDVAKPDADGGTRIRED